MMSELSNAFKWIVGNIFKCETTKMKLAKNIKNWFLSKNFFFECFECLCKNFYLFYLVMLPLVIRWAFMKYDIKLEGLTKAKARGFCQDLCEYDLVLYP